MRQLKINKQFTNRENKSLDKYLNEISKVEMITPTEEVELAKRIKEDLEKAEVIHLPDNCDVNEVYLQSGVEWFNGRIAA